MNTAITAVFGIVNPIV